MSREEREPTFGAGPGATAGIMVFIGLMGYLYVLAGIDEIKRRPQIQLEARYLQYIDKNNNGYRDSTEIDSFHEELADYCRKLEVTPPTREHFSWEQVDEYLRYVMNDAKN